MPKTNKYKKCSFIDSKLIRKLAHTFELDHMACNWFIPVRIRSWNVQLLYRRGSFNHRVASRSCEQLQLMWTNLNSSESVRIRSHKVELVWTSYKQTSEELDVTFGAKEGIIICKLFIKIQNGSNVTIFSFSLAITEHSFYFLSCLALFKHFVVFSSTLFSLSCLFLFTGGNQS
jgi:hypothetical protein